jgi:high-affinity nickel-transport protein
VLGIRHGLDADHLAAIDGLTRYNFASNPRLARWSGVMFSLGHGGVVLLVAALTGSAVNAYELPDWLQAVGAWISIAFLVALGVANLRAVLGTPAHETVQLSGFRASLLLRLTRTGRPVGIVAIGALFAMSFDTLSQALLFSATAGHFGGVDRALILGGLFALGMILVDGLNSTWVAGLLRRQDRRARVASRAIGVFVAMLSFAVAILGAVRYFSADADVAVGAYESIIGVLFVLTAAVGIVIIGHMIGPGNPAPRASDVTESAPRSKP